MTHYISEQELNAVKGLLHYLNQNLQPIDGLAVDAQVIDSNGESLGTVKWSAEAGAGYVLAFPEASA